MDLYLIRHAEAVSLGEGGVTEDADRPLTERGREQAKAVASGLQRRGVRLAVLVTSPFLRARQTAEELLRHWPAPAPPVEACEALAPGGRPKKVTRFLNGVMEDVVALVGHMPDLGVYAGWLIGSKKAQLDLAKAGAAHVLCPDRPRKGSGTLLWLVTPEWLD